MAALKPAPPKPTAPKKPQPDMRKVCVKVLDKVTAVGLQGPALERATVDVCANEVFSLPAAEQPPKIRVHVGCRFFAKHLTQENENHNGAVSINNFCNNLVAKTGAAGAKLNQAKLEEVGVPAVAHPAMAKSVKKMVVTTTALPVATTSTVAKTTIVAPVVSTTALSVITTTTVAKMTSAALVATTTALPVIASTAAVKMTTTTSVTSVAAAASERIADPVRPKPVVTETTMPPPAAAIATFDADSMPMGLHAATRFVKQLRTVQQHGAHSEGQPVFSKSQAKNLQRPAKKTVKTVKKTPADSAVTAATAAQKDDEDFLNSFINRYHEKKVAEVDDRHKHKEDVHRRASELFGSDAAPLPPLVLSQESSSFPGDAAAPPVSGDFLSSFLEQNDDAPHTTAAPVAADDSDVKSLLSSFTTSA